MEQKLILSSPKAQPFGLLSSNAITEFTVGSNEIPDPKYKFKHGSWKTVSQYVYINMFKKEDNRQRMSEMLHRNSYVNMLYLRDQLDNDLYSKEILKGLSARFRQYEKLRVRLYQTRGKQLVHDDKNIIALLNNIRSPNKDVVYDPKQNIEVSRVEVLQVISGVEDEIRKNPSLSDDLDYKQLRKYAKKYGYKDLPLNDDIFININYIVPIVKYRLRESLWSKNIEKFKDHLLDTFLDYILETEYINIDASDYAKAKREQIIKEKKLDLYKDQLYNLYEAGMKDDDHILDRLKVTPDKTLREMGRDANNIDIKIMTPDAQADKIYIKPDDPFLPHFIEDIEINGKIYKSAVHYAYEQLITNLLNIGNLPGLETFDVNTVSLKDLIQTYNNIKSDWIHHNLKNNNEIATSAKFRQYSTLDHLLLATWWRNITWNNKADPILGVGNDGKGENITGNFLMYLRDLYVNIEIPEEKISAFGSIAGNIWTNSWMISMAQDFKNTTLLLENPTTADLEIIYDINAIKDSTPGDDDLKSLRMAGLDNYQIKIIFPMIVALYIPMREMTDRELMNEQGMIYFMDGDYKGRQEDLEYDAKEASQRLKRISESLKLAQGVNQHKFIVSILSNKITEDQSEQRWNRIYKWSRAPTGHHDPIKG